MAGTFTQQSIGEFIAEAVAAGKSMTRPDSANLYLQAVPTGEDGCAVSWLFRYQVNGRRRWMGLGSYPTVSATKARSERDTLRKKVKAGIDPLAEREASKAAQKAAGVRQRRQSTTFKDCAESFIDSKESEWRNPKHRQQWRNTLRDYAYPKLGRLPVADVNTENVLEVLTPIWNTKTETAKRVQGRIERVLDYAKVKELREGENPARWRGHLDNTLPKPGKVHRVTHQRALPYSEAPALQVALEDLDTPAARALLLTLHCATRTSESLGATWEEIDLDARLWTIPSERMKAGKPHRIPLSASAVDVLRQQDAKRVDQWVFPGQKRGRSLSYMAMTNVLKRSGWLRRTTVHGLRSTFRDWVSERTNYPDRLAEVALAHQLSDRVQAAYNRTDQLEKRRDMMEAWAHFLSVSSAKVVSLPSQTTRNVS